jgi:hypothetical protein
MSEHEDSRPRCMHGRYRIDPCIGCGRRYVDSVLTGPFLTDENSRPRFGQIIVREIPDGVLIDRADEWVQVAGELLEALLTPATPWVTVDGLHLTFRDSLGTVCRYVVAPQVSCPAGTVVLHRVQELTPAVLPEHTR